MPGDPRPTDARAIAMARTVAAPAIFLILNGLLGLVVAGLLSVPFVFNPDSFTKWMKDAIANQPAGPEKQDLEQKIADFEKQVDANREEYIRQNAFGLLVAAVVNLVVLAGGVYMRSLSGYSMSMVGALIALIPCTTGCCLTGIPFGLWALVVLNRPEVKAAFAARRLTPSNPDDQYMR